MLDIAARYEVGGMDEAFGKAVWTDMPEAQPRTRARLMKAGEPEVVTVYSDGTLDFDQSLVEIDTDY